MKRIDDLIQILENVRGTDGNIEVRLSDPRSTANVTYPVAMASKWLTPSGLTLVLVLIPGEPVKGPTRTKIRVFRYLRGASKPLSISAIARGAGTSYGSTWRLLHGMLKAGEVARVGGLWFKR